MTRAQLGERFNGRFYDPAFEGGREAIARLESIAWQALQDGRKAPFTRPAGRGFADATFEVSVQRLDTQLRLVEAKPVEQQGSDYPKHMAGRAYGGVVHGGVAGVEVHRRILCD